MSAVPGGAIVPPAPEPGRGWGDLARELWGGRGIVLGWGAAGTVAALLVRPAADLRSGHHRHPGVAGLRTSALEAAGLQRRIWPLFPGASAPWHPEIARSRRLLEEMLAMRSPTGRGDDVLLIDVVQPVVVASLRRPFAKLRRQVDAVVDRRRAAHAACARRSPRWPPAWPTPATAGLRRPQHGGLPAPTASSSKALHDTRAELTVPRSAWAFRENNLRIGNSRACCSSRGGCAQRARRRRSSLSSRGDELSRSPSIATCRCSPCSTLQRFRHARFATARLGDRGRTVDGVAGAMPSPRAPGRRERERTQSGGQP